MSASANAAFLVLALGHIVARYAGRRSLAAPLKPLPIILLALAVALYGTGGDRFRACIVAGLLLSSLGDVWLVFPTRFREGLVSFFLAHLLYIAAFAPDVPWDGRVWLPLVVFGALAGDMLTFLWPHLGRERPAVALYVTTIAVMAWCAAVRALAVPAPGGLLAAVGAAVFMVSDSLLATDRFVRPYRAAHTAVMVTYYTAQWLIAASALS